MPRFGFNVHLWNEPQEVIARKLEVIQSLGATLVRWDVPWSQVERKKGTLQIPPKWFYIARKIESLGLQSIYILDYGNPYYSDGAKPTSESHRLAFGAYAKYIASTLGQRGSYGVEIWNEWDQTAGGQPPGSPSDYAELVRHVSAELRSVDPNLKIIAGALGSSAYKSLLSKTNTLGYFESLLSLNICKHIDVLSIHPYTLYRSEVPNNGDGVRMMIEKIVDFARSAPSGRTACPRIGISEIGWSTAHDPKGVSPQVQTSGLQSVTNSAVAERLEFSIFYELRDGGNDKINIEDNFGVLHSDWSPKTSFEQIRKILQPSNYSP